MAYLKIASGGWAFGQRRSWLVGLSFACLFLTALRLGFAGAIGLTDDEAYYRMWSFVPAMSYLDHPPMIAWLIGAGRCLVGDTTLGIRLAAPLLMLLGAIVLWRTAAILYGSRIATRAVWFLLAMPLIAVGGVIVTPDLPSVFFSGLVVWSLAELERSQNPTWWLAVGIFAGCGLLSKYTNLFMGLTIVIWLLAVPGNRHWFRSSEFWVAGLLAALLASPVIVWNGKHNWASFTKQFGRVVTSSTGMPGAFVLEMLGGFLALASPVIAVLSAIGLYSVIRRAVVSRNSADVLLASAITPMLCYFVFHALHGRVQANWLAPLYPFLGVCAALAVDAAGRNASWKRHTTNSAITLGMLATAVIFLHAAFPFGLDLPKDPTTQMRGWDKFAEDVNRRRELVGARWIATSSYATTAQLAFALKTRVVVEQLTERLRYVDFPSPSQALLNQPALYVELTRRVQLPLLRRAFASVTEQSPILRADGRGGVPYSVFVVSGPVGSLTGQITGQIRKTQHLVHVRETRLASKSMHASGKEIASNHFIPRFPMAFWYRHRSSIPCTSYTGQEPIPHYDMGVDVEGRSAAMQFLLEA